MTGEVSLELKWDEGLPVLIKNSHLIQFSCALVENFGVSGHFIRELRQEIINKSIG